VARPAVYGLLGGTIPQDIGRVFNRESETLKAAIHAAVADGRIPAGVDAQTDGIVTRLQDDAPRAFVHTGDGAPTSAVGAPSRRFVPGADLQAAFLRAYTSHDGPIESFWRPSAPMLGSRAMAWPTGSTRLPARDTHQEQSAAARAPAAAGRRQRHQTSLRELAALDERDWLAILRTPVNGQPIARPRHAGLGRRRATPQFTPPS